MVDDIALQINKLLFGFIVNLIYVKQLSMINSVNFNHLPIQDLVVSGLIIFIISTIIANIYDPLLGITYAFGNILTLTFLSWLYKETWSDPKK